MISDTQSASSGAASLAFEDLNGRVDGRGDLAPLLNGRLRGAFACWRGSLCGRFASAGGRDRNPWPLCPGGCLALRREALVSTATDFLRFRRLFVLALGALTTGGCARIAVGLKRPPFLVSLLGIPVIVVAFQDAALGQGRRARLGGQTRLP